eukprot:s1873_g9.t1
MDSPQTHSSSSSENTHFFETDTREQFAGADLFEAFYREQQICSKESWDLCWRQMRLPLPPCVRLPEANEGVLSLLLPWDPKPVPWCPKAYRLAAEKAVDDQGHYKLELAKVLADGQRAGKIIRQESASMLPAQALDIRPEHTVLELCAAPGSKTLQILDLMQPEVHGGGQVTGLLVANDSKASRLRKLVDRVRRIPTAPLVVTRADARRFPVVQRHADGRPIHFDRVLCDVPCSGDGTMRKARSLLDQWTPRSAQEPQSPEGGGRPQMAGSTSVAVTGGGGQETGYFRDREPPPAYDGESPETTFMTYEKNVRLWEFETDVPPVKRGVKLLRALTGSARLAVDEMPFEDIANERGVYNIMAKLKEYYQPHLEVSLPRAFEAAVYGPIRPAKEGFAEYIARCDKAFGRLQKEGEQRFLVYTEGRYDRKSVVTALRKLDRVVKEKSKSHYMVAEEEIGEYEDPYELIANEEDENVIYLQEGDLDEVLEEADVVAAFANYQEIRRAVRDQQKGRGYYKGLGKGRGFGNFQDGKGKGRWKRVHQEQVKLRTRCWRCNQIGHMSRECKNEPNIRGSAASVASVGGSSTATGKSGFLVFNEPADGEEHQSHFWLRQFVKERAETSASVPPEVYKGENAAFHGITTMPECGVVDTAAEGGLIGSFALQRIEDRLSYFGLKCKWTPKKSAAKGVGGSANVIGVIMLPIGIGGINGLLECTVVDGDVPLLLPIRMMRALKTVIDLDSMQFTMKEYGITVSMSELPSGHVTIGIMDFENGSFSVPDGAQCWLSREVKTIRKPHVVTKAVCEAMQSLMSRMKTLGRGAEASTAASASKRDPKASSLHHPKRARKLWRVLLDKIFLLLEYSKMQEAVEEWFPRSQPLPVFSLAPKEETIQDVYAELIQVEKSLPPLKSKEEAAVARSSCVHPKHRLRGGGNRTQSYIVCRDCHSRWENPYTSAGLHQQMKQMKKEKKQGLLSKMGPKETEEQMDWDTEMPEEDAEEMTQSARYALMKAYVEQQKEREAEIEKRHQKEIEERLKTEKSRSMKEIKQLKDNLEEQQEGAAEMTRLLQTEMQELRKQVERLKAKGAKPKNSATPSTPEKTEGKMRPASKSPSGSYSVVSSNSPRREKTPRRLEEPVRRRSKSPRRSLEQTEAAQVAVPAEEISDTDS